MIELTVQEIQDLIWMLQHPEWKWDEFAVQKIAKLLAWAEQETFLEEF